MITAKDILDFYEQHNFRLVFWPRVGDVKGPQQTGWTEKVYHRATDYREGHRVGIVCGHPLFPDKYFVDFDLDYAPGMNVALAMLPATDFIYGRKSKTISHCGYTTSAPIVSFKFEDPTDNICLLEIRGTKQDGTLGMQSMAPPSVWSKNGTSEPLEFSRMSLPNHVADPEILLRAARLGAIGMLLAKHFGKQGFNHEKRLLWAGFLLNAGVTSDELMKMGHAIIGFTENIDTADIKLSIDSTARRLAGKDKKVQGGPALASALGANGLKIIKRINSWLGRDDDFKRDKNGHILKDRQENVARALQLLRYDIAFDEFAGKPTLNRTQLIEDRQMTEMWFRIDQEYHFRPSLEFFQICLKHIAWSNPYHPVREYLDGLTWDGVPRIDEWLILAGGAADSEYTRAVSAIVLIAAVRRARKPGCKYDEMVVLESDQGLQKSSALRALCPNPDWFSDDFELGVTSQRMIEATQGEWIIEASELSGMRPAQIELLKSNLSRQIDGPARLAYAHLPVEIPRQFILFGTTNSKAYLADPTGARRFWPIEVQKFLVEWIELHRDQLWAEAAFREKAGESIRLHESLWESAGDVQEKRRELDPWEALIKTMLMDDATFHEYRDGRTRVATSDLWNCIGMPPERRSHRDQMRITDTMQRLWFTRTRVRLSGEAVQVGFISDDPSWRERQRNKESLVETLNAGAKLDDESF